ncbi:MAG: cytochrome c [Alphaproteobacteria bacterium]|nr:cytochrome c [Alphaproteobacteria bacterium]
MKFKFLIPSIAAVAMIGGTLAVTGVSQADVKTSDGYSVSVAQADLGATLKKRNSLMKNISKTRKGLSGAAKKGKIGPAEVAAAEKLAALTKQLDMSLWPKGSGSDMHKTRSKPDIWNDTADFQKRVAKMQKAAADGATAAKGGDAKAVAKAMGDMGCGGCHKKYRGPKVK